MAGPLTAIPTVLMPPSPDTGNEIMEEIECGGLAATRPSGCSPGSSNGSAASGRMGSAASWRMAASRGEREVQRRVHPHVSRQYQRTSWQALPPSATIWLAGMRMPHIQHDLTWADSPQNGGRCCRSVMTCSPRSPTGRAVVSARAMGPLTVAEVRSASSCSAESLALMHTSPFSRVSAVPPAHLTAVETRGLTMSEFQSPTVLSSDHR